MSGIPEALGPDGVSARTQNTVLREALKIACDALAKSEHERDRAADVLRSLHDVQNGSPLPSYDKAWEAAMLDAKDVLRELGK